MSTPASGASPSPNSAMMQPLIASHPRSMTRSARTRRALARIKSEYFSDDFSLMAPSRSHGKAGDINDGIGDAVPDIGVVHDGDDAGAAALALGNQIDH